MKDNKIIKNNIKLLVFMYIAIIIFSCILSETIKNNMVYISNTIETHPYFSSNQENELHLTDIDYISSQSFTRYDRIRYNEVNGGGKITLKIENSNFTFEKGIWAHATSQVTYDISKYNYKYFTTFIGLNTTSNGGNGVLYSIYTSEDGKNWEAKIDKQAQLPRQSATFVKIELNGAKYLRLIANDNGGNGQDHSVYADPKLVNELDKSSFMSVEEYNDIIKKQYNGESNITGELENNLLKRELVQKVGQYTINSFYNASNENKETLNWLLNNQDILRDYILGGDPEGGSYYNSLTQLSRLYYNYKEDFTNKELLNNKWYPSLTYGDLYTKMAISLSLTHSQNVGLWMQSGSKENKSDAVKRYAIYKYMHKNGKLKATESINMTPWFEALHIEEMRFIMNNAIDDEEILWLNDYVQSKIDETPNRASSLLTPHPYMAYIWPNYGNDLYYIDENKEYFNELFSIPDKNNEGKRIGLFDLSYTIPGGKESPEYTISITRGTTNYKLYKLWMNFRNKFGTGAVCGGISKSGSNIRATHGIPATVIGQPGHAALLYYTKLDDGRGTWGIDNDVSGWTLSEKGERLLLGWGNANTNYAKGSYQVVYMQLSQEAINDYDNLVKAEKLVKLAKSYKDDLIKQEEIYRKALSIQNINLDAWLGLIEVYNQSTMKNEDEYYKLAEEIAEGLKDFPLPMYHLTNLIKPKLTSVQSSYKFTLLQTRTLTAASQLTTSDKIVSPSLTRTEANYLLGKIDKTIATFSFDGDNAEKIVLSSRFDGNGVRWDYSLDGKQTWNEVSFTADEPHKLKLTKEQIASITAENDIYVHIVGVNYKEENLYKIDITNGTLPTYDNGDYLYGNDLENRVIGVDTTMEWRMAGNTKWTSYKDSSPDLTGNKTVEVRVGATGTKLPSPLATFTFTQDVQSDTRKYIPVSHLTLHSVSTEATAQRGNATYAIDGNYNTRWHSAWNGTDTNRFISIKLDNPAYLSAVEFVPAGGGNGKIYDGTIWGSMDGENWFVLSQKTGLTYTNQANTIDQAKANIKNFDIENVKEVQYVKIVADRTNGNWITARAFNFYQDLTKNEHPTAGIGYSTTDLTNQNVIARLVNPSTKIKITNNNGSDTYTFTENGEFTFEFIDEVSGLTGRAKAKVDWIDKEVPTAEIEYSTTNPTNQEVSATIKNFSEEVELITSSDNSEDIEIAPNANPYTVIFEKNAEHTFQFKDKAGNIGTLVAKVTWIDKEAPTAEIEYSTTDPTNREVTAKLVKPSEEITVVNNEGKKTYTFTENGTFEFIIEDKAGNRNKIIATVNNIDKEVPTAEIEYSTKDVTNKNVEVTLKNYSENITITNNNGSNQYTFTENGEFRFEFINTAGKKGYTTARVTWIDKEAPTAKIEYSTTNPTNQDVIVTLKDFSEEITILNNNGSNIYTFTENGTFEFIIEDKAGNTNTLTAIVKNIDKTIPKANIKYNITKLTNQNVIVTLVDLNEGIKILNNNGSNSYTFTKNGEFIFEFINTAGTKGATIAKVDWIDKEAPTAKIEYSTTSKTNQNVTVTLKDYSEEITILNNNGSNKYTFTKNGTFEFIIEDKAGNRNTVIATVNWISKKESTSENKTTSKNASNTNKTINEIIANNSSNINNSIFDNNKENNTVDNSNNNEQNVEKNQNNEENNINNEKANIEKIKQESKAKSKTVFNYLFLLILILILILIIYTYYKKSKSEK